METIIEKKLTVGVIGEVSRGKTSLINAVLGTIKGACSRQRSTFEAVKYKAKNDISDEILLPNIDLADVGELMKKSHEQRVNNVPVNFNMSTLSYDDMNNIGIDIIDFPGVNDATDTEEKFMKLFIMYMHQCDIIIYITSAESAFIQASEVALYKNIVRLIEISNNTGNYITLITVINKYDDKHDEDILAMYQGLDKNIYTNVFRMSSHQMLINRMYENRIKLSIPKELKQEFRNIFKNIGTYDKYMQDLLKGDDTIVIDFSDDRFANFDGDWDGLLKFINNYKKDYQDNSKAHVLKYLQANVPVDADVTVIVSDHVQQNVILPGSPDKIGFIQYMKNIKTIINRYDFNINNYMNWFLTAFIKPMEAHDVLKCLIYPLISALAFNKESLWKIILNRGVFIDYKLLLLPEVIHEKVEIILSESQSNIEISENMGNILTVLSRFPGIWENEVFMYYKFTTSEDGSIHLVSIMDEYKNYFALLLNDSTIDYLHKLSCMDYFTLIHMMYHDKIDWKTIKSVSIALKNNLDMRLHCKDTFMYNNKYINDAGKPCLKYLLFQEVWQLDK